MAASVIDGKAIAQRLREDVKKSVATMFDVCGVIPGLAVISVGDDPASQIYLRNKLKGLAEVGMRGFEHKFRSNTKEKSVLHLINKLKN